ncbi:MAG: hypothetical protein R3337_01180 [Gammaproteobacteria bacterium]|nr:hypothetical protein [Gammaproteobacteria bacterium]
MTADSVKPHKETLREAVRWLSQNAPVTRDRIDEAAARFDLSPLEAEFLIREFLKPSE